MDINNLSNEEIEEYRQAFNLFDRDGDGTISSKELGTVMLSLGQNPSQEELEELINEVDIDGNGIIDFEEFILMMAKKASAGESENDLREAFRIFDEKATGYISLDELRRVMTTLGDKMSEDEFQDMLSELNYDKTSCQIEYQHIINIMMDQ